MANEPENEMSRLVQQAVDEERRRIGDLVLDEYQHWKEYDGDNEDVGLIAIGAMATSANLYAKIHNLKMVNEDPRG